MHNNYYFLRHLSKALDQELKGYSVVSCFSQNKEELIIELNNGQESFFIKAHLLSSFCCLSFPSQFSRARKNSVDLFDEVILKKVNAVKQFQNERSFEIALDQGYSLIFKMHANRSNVLLSKDGVIFKIFRNQFKADLAIEPSKLEIEIDWREQHFHQHTDNLKETYFTLGKEVWAYLAEKNFETLPPTDRWQLFYTTIQKLQDPTFFILKNRKTIRLSLLPHGEIVAHFENPIKVINEFFHLYTCTDVLTKEKARVRKQLTAQLTGWQSYLEKNQKKLNEISDRTPYKTWADILMANIHLIGKGVKTIVLNDFSNNPVTIKLKPELNTQKNAEIYYRKAKNQDKEIAKLSESIAQKQNEIKECVDQLDLLEKTETLADFRHHFKANPKASKKEITLPFHKVEHLGFQIWIGKNAISNDLLTLKHAHKDDLWLHAKDVSGSHVVIKHQSGKKFPKVVIERAAELAAYNSKRKTETLCPVAYTLKKNVRKRKGDLPGAVIVEREEVILVQPKL